MSKEQVKKLGGGKGIRKLGAAIVALMLVVAMVIGLFPANTMAATISDEATAEGYAASLGNNISTEYAGRVWSDKSVYAGNAEFEMFGGTHGTVEKSEDEDFLVAFSTLGTSQAVSGQTQAPVDVVFVIDTSGSMNDDMSSTDRTNRIVNTVEALNNSIDAVMDLNPYTRVAVVAFSSTAEVMLPLGRYEKGTRGNGQNQTENYFSLSGNSSTLYKHAKVEGTTTQNSGSRSVTGGTNIQMGLYTGMNVLASVDSNDVTTTINGTTVNRVPAVILLSDGAPTYSSSSDSWWSPANNSGNGPGSNPSNDTYYIGNGMKALMTGAYMKDAVNRKYNVDATVYTVGMGISYLSGHERNLAYMTLDPESSWAQTNNVASDIKSAWTTYQGGADVTVNVGTVRNNSYRDANYTIEHPTQYDISSNVNALKEFVDDYYDADSASEVTDVFNEIVSNISISTPEVPTELKGSDPIDETGYITYTDPIGEYMTVGDVKAIVYAGTVYTQKEVTTVDNVTTYEFTAQVESNIYGSQSLKDILIQVTEDVNGNETLTVKVPASVIPVRVNTVELNKDGSVKSHTNNGAYPVRVVYSVNLKDEITTTVNGKEIVDVTALSQEYIKENSTENGQIYFYSNLYTGENSVTVLDNGVEVTKTAGNATVEFEPSHSNPFYYMQEDIPIYTDEAATIPADADTPLVDTQVYYYKSQFYNGTTIVNDILSRTGAQLKKTDMVEVDGQWHRAAGSPRLNRILEFEGTKKDNSTETAADFYAPTFQYAAGSTDSYAGKYVIYLGNNGRIAMDASGLLEISKEVEVPAGLTPGTTEFSFTVNFNGTAELAGSYAFDILNEDGDAAGAGTITDGGKITLQDGQTVRIKNLPHGTTYTVVEGDAAGFTTTVNGTTTNTASGTITAGTTSTAAFVNAYSVTSVTVPASAGFQGTKSLDGRGWLDTDSFTFILESRSVDTPMPEGSVQIDQSHMAKEVTLSGRTDAQEALVEFAFGDIVYTKPGTFEYVISEKQPIGTPIAGISYSGAMYTVVVTVTDNGFGQLEADVVMTQIVDDTGNSVPVPLAEGEALAAFVNKFDAASVNWMPVGTKDYMDYSGANPITTGMFKFKVEALDANGYATGNEEAVSKENAPMPTDEVVSQVTNVDVEIAYEAITFTQEEAGLTKENAKVYAYKFTEVNEAKPGYTYDANEYIVVVKVYLDGNTVVIEATYPANEAAFPTGTPSRVVFFNKYEPTPTNVVLEGTKTLTGRDMKADEEFKFALAAMNKEAESLTLPEEASVSGGTNGSAVEFAFKEIQFTKPGTYKFEMKEIVPEGYVEGTRADGIVYDTHSCIITVVVEDHNGVLVAGTPTYEGGSAFTNTYDTIFDENDTVNLYGNKTLTGRDIIDGEFTFSVEAQESAPMGDSYATNSANENGTISLLRNVTYDKAGTYTYLIKEILPAAATTENEYTAYGVKYDTAIYKYTVVVEDVEQIGILSVTSTKLEKSTDGGVNFAEADAVQPIFENVYTTTPAERNVPVMEKVLDGYRNHAIKENEFQFTMSVAGTTLAGTEISATDLETHITLTGDIDGPANGIWGPIGNEEGAIVDEINSAAINFGTIKFHKEGVYTLTFSEVKGNVAGTSYTDETLVATFKVTDNGRGALVAELLSLYGNYTFTNTYETSGELTLELEKKFSGRDWLADDSFEFEVVILDPATQEAVTNGHIVFPTLQEDNGIQKVVINKESTLVEDTEDHEIRKMTSPTITINKPGTYKFRVHEVAGNILGVNYDSTPRDVTIVATDDGVGNITYTYDVKDGDGNDITLRFENVYDADSTELSGHNDLVIRKTFTGRANNQWLETDSFEFELKAVSAVDEDGAALDVNDVAVLELPNTTLVVNNANKAYPHFGNIKFHKAGTYVFEVKEVIPEGAVFNKLAGITYDPTVYTITVKVGDNYKDATLVVESVVYTNNSGETKDSLAFTNTYTVEEIASTPIPVSKKITGRDWFTTDVFKFTLEAVSAVDENGNELDVTDPEVLVLPENAANLEISTADKDYTDAFDAITFKVAGTYSFVIKEVAGNDNNITYDTHLLEVNIVVEDNNNGTLTAVAPFYSGSSVFENIYTPDPIEVALKGTKSLTGRDLAAGEFRFHIEAETADAPLPAVRTVTNGNAEDTEAIEFGAIRFTKAGTYEYTISEIAGNLAGVVYDKTPVSVTVNVLQNSEGILEATVTYKKGEVTSNSSFNFANAYTTQQTDVVSIKATKKVTPEHGHTYVMQGGEFEFVLTHTKNNIIKTTNAADGSFGFNMVYTKPGTYEYTLHEVDNKLDGISYDDTSYEITVVVKDNVEIAKLEATVTIVKKTAESSAVVDSIVFDNGYDPEHTHVVIQGNKTLDSEHKGIEANEFEFQIEAVSGPEGIEIPMPDATKVKNSVTGFFQFGSMQFEQEGTYVYTVSEAGGQKDGYTYDETKYTVTVTVTDKDEAGANTGQLAAVVEYSVGNQKKEAIAFTNYYVPEKTNVVIGGSKNLTGREINAGEFAFSLLDGTTKIETVNSGADGAFQFAAIEYDKTGTYNYTIVEEHTHVDGVTYDDLEKVYAVQVIVTDEGYDGHLDATVKYYHNDEEVATKDVVFNNSYKAAPTEVALGAAKVLEGREIDESEFTFLLEAITPDAPMPEEGRELAKNDTEGGVDFGTIVFENAGTYEYQISEVKGEDQYVTYDSSVFKVTVEVTDDLEGQLVAKVSGIKDVVFYNYYMPDPIEVTFGGEKQLNGREMKAEEFEFILKDAEGNVLDEVANNAEGTFTFDAVVFEEAGHYYYTIEEKNTNVKGVTYDTGICYVHVEVVDDYEGHLIPTVTYGKDAEMDETVVFVNSYKAASTSVQISATKKLAGRDMNAGEFRFVLEDENGNKIYATNDADGAILFGKITYEEAGTYVYKLYEEKGKDANVTYDDEVYTVTVVVEDNLNGLLKVTSKFDEKQFVFENVYKNPESVSTGDTMNIMPIMTMFMLSAGYILVSLVKARKR